MSNKHMEVIHHRNYDATVMMPFVPAIKINSGRLLWLAGATALPVYHDHPHRREDLAKLPDNLEAQTRTSMEGIKKTLRSRRSNLRRCCTHLCVPGAATDGGHWKSERDYQFLFRSV